MKEIMLSNGQKTQVSDCDFFWLSGYSWTLDKDGYAIGRVNGSMLKMHSLIAKSMNINRPDHRDQNTLNNQRGNLRESTHSQNCANRSKRKGTFCQYKGVSWHKKKQKYVAQITVNCIKIDLGSYFTEKEAAIAYNYAAKLYFGEFAALNPV